jgi:hypothetical protein
MCRVRFGYAHVANNKYDEWKMYAIGGSSNPTILSEGNFFIAPNDNNAKQVKTNTVYIVLLFQMQPFRILSLMWLFLLCVTDYKEGSKGKLEELEMEVF